LCDSQTKTLVRIQSIVFASPLPPAHTVVSSPITDNEEWVQFDVFMKVSVKIDWLRAGWPRGRSSSSGKVKNFLFSMSSRPALGSTQPLTQWVSWGVKLQGREADHSPQTSAEVKKMWIYTTTFPLPTPSWRSA
jgi:hypothetical protein